MELPWKAAPSILFYCWDKVSRGTKADTIWWEDGQGSLQGSRLGKPVKYSIILGNTFQKNNPQAKHIMSGAIKGLERSISMC